MIDNAAATMASVRQITDEVARANPDRQHPGGGGETQAAVASLNVTYSNDLPQLMTSRPRCPTRPRSCRSTSSSLRGPICFRPPTGSSRRMAWDQVPASLTASLDALRQITVGLQGWRRGRQSHATLASADKAATALSDASTDCRS